MGVTADERERERERKCVCVCVCVRKPLTHSFSTVSLICCNTRILSFAVALYLSMLMMILQQLPYLREREREREKERKKDTVM